MSTFFIYPIEHLPNNNNKQDEPTTAMTTLSSNGLSRILEIPLSLLDADTNQKINNKNATDQLFWLSTTTNVSNNTPNIPNTINTTTVTTGNNTSTPTVTNQCENNNSTEVTHSFANRKRSIVKRRKSVLSSSYTAHDEAEAIKSDRKATLATLERGTKEEETEKENISIEDTTAAPQEGNNRGQLGVNEEEEEQQEIEKDKSKNTIYNMEQIIPKDSAIDLRTTTLEPEDLKIMETSSPIIESTSFTSLTPPSPTLTPAIVMTTKKKKASSWSPRKMFQSNNNNTRKKEAKPEKFNITSLFSRSLPKKTLLVKTSSKSVLINEITATGTTKKPEFQLKSNFNYTRLPIHTERAIYRLSHMKLTNPRRPLCDQVTISNLMFWYLSIISQQNHNNNNINENDLAPSDMQIDQTMTKKSCRIQIQHRRTTTNKKRNTGGNKRIRNHQIGPDLHHSNAMDTLNNKQRYKNTHLRTSNSSSDEEEEDEGFSDDDLSDIEDESIPDLYNNDKKKKKGKYSLFQKNSHWLSFSSSHKQQNERQQDEDDIPLAMYQKGKTP